MATRPIVVGVDGSEESLRAVDWAAMEAARHKAPLRIVAAPAVPPRIRAYELSPRAVSNALLGMAARALDAGISRAEEVEPGLRIETELLADACVLAAPAAAWRAVPGTAVPPAVAVTDSGAEALMLVVGARGAGGFAAMLLGSVSRYAATHGPCPVVVVHEQTMAVHRTVAVGIRDPRDAADALGFAAEEAVVRGAELVVVHVVPLAGRAFGRHLGAQASDAEEIRQVLTEAEREVAEELAAWRRKYPTLAIRHDVVHGHQAQILASYCARADLVVLGRHDRRGMEAPGPRGTAGGHAVGSTRFAVLNHAPGPIAVVPCAS